MKKYIIVMVALVISVCSGMIQPVFARDGIDVEIDNHLAECMDIHPVHRQEMDNLIILKTTVTLKKSTGECGCLSAFIRYTSLLAQDVEGYGRGNVYFLQEGNFSLANMQGRYPFSFVLSVDNQSVRNQKLALMIRCTPPL